MKTFQANFAENKSKVWNICLTLEKLFLEGFSTLLTSILEQTYRQAQKSTFPWIIFIEFSLSPP